ncbi:Pre-rRNA-processing protein esf2 [Fonsecaea pedrosoi]|nr:Pre-rRNA-processing protein esf2 [Fonsecaea pedrosoi]
MSSDRRNMYLDAGFSDESDQDVGYDSEAAEVSKAGRASKRRKIERESTDEEEELDAYDLKRRRTPKEKKKKQTASGPSATVQPEFDDRDDVHENEEDYDDGEDAKHVEKQGRDAEATNATAENQELQSASATGEPTNQKKPKKSKHKETTPGVVYLSSLPPYLKPSALRNLLEQRGFSPIKRLFLSPASRHAHNSKKNSRQLYTEGWIEFSSKKIARRCAETLNATTVGGKKGGYYRDDLWNMKYLKGMAWEELMAGIREEKREEEGRRDEERRTIAQETKRFIEGVEEGRRVEGIKRKKAGRKGDREETGNSGGGDSAVDVRRTWRQTEVKGKKKGQDSAVPERISDDVKQVLNRIF